MQEGRIAGQTNEAASAAERLAAAHKALTADSSIQFDMPPAPPPPQTPAWLRAFLEWLEHALKPVGRLFRWIGSFLPDAPYARILFWTVIALAAVALLGLVYQRLRHGEWRLPRRRSRFAAQAEVEEASWAPEAAPAQAWLEEADALAAQGRFAEAARHLLFRSVEDIARRRPSLVRPALTSRELASAPAVPPTARELFARIAALVERSLFGGRAVEAGDWTSARAAYADFVLPRAWRA